MSELLGVEQIFLQRFFAGFPGYVSGLGIN
jgi:hypothetical protein